MPEAKRYVADKLGCGVRDLSDPVAMEQIRVEKGLGTVQMTSTTRPTEPGMMEAKFNIAEVLEIPINCVELFRRRAGLERLPSLH